MSRLMRVMVMFDLPVKTAAQRREANRFRRFLINDGYFMMQKSVYARICPSEETTAAHHARVRANTPAGGLVHMLILTEKQFESIDIIVGVKKKKEEPPESFTEL